MSRRRLPRIFGFWDRFATVPYLPVVAWVAVIGWTGVFHGGISPTGNHELPYWLVMAWTLAFAVGASFATIGGLTRRTQIESAGLGLLLAGLLFFGFVGVVEGSPGVTVSVVAFSLMCIIRMRVLTQARKAQALATDIIKSLGGE